MGSVSSRLSGLKPRVSIDNWPCPLALYGDIFLSPGKVAMGKWRATHSRGFLLEKEMR